MRWKTHAGVGVLALALAAIPLAQPGVGAEGQQPEVQSGDQVGPAAGLFAWSGGPVRGKRARTQTAATGIPESATWVSLPNATLAYAVPTGTTDLFNIAFSAECRLVNGGGDDYVRIRILDNGVPVEPYDGAQAFCSANAYATHAGHWAKRVTAGNHILQVQFWIFDGAPAEALQAIIDDWTFEVVVYD
jgi:hypothetical protein